MRLLFALAWPVLAAAGSAGPEAALRVYLRAPRARAADLARVIASLGERRLPDEVLERLAPEFDAKAAEIELRAVRRPGEWREIQHELALLSREFGAGLPPGSRRRIERAWAGAARAFEERLLRRAGAQAADLLGTRDAGAEYLVAWEAAARPWSPAQVAALKGYKVLFVKGLLADARRRYFGDSIDALRSHGVEAELVATNAQAPPERNVGALAAAIAGAGKPVLLVSHSKGGVDVLEALRARPELVALVRGWVPISGPFHGSPVADWFLAHGLPRLILRALLRLFDGAESAVSALAVARRLEYMAAHEAAIAEIVARVPIISFATWSDRRPGWRASLAGRIGRRVLTRLGVRSDGLVPLASGVLPGAELVVVGGVEHAMPARDSTAPFDRARFTRAVVSMLLSRAERR